MLPALLLCQPECRRTMAALTTSKTKTQWLRLCALVLLLLKLLLLLLPPMLLPRTTIVNVIKSW